MLSAKDAQELSKQSLQKNVTQYLNRIEEAICAAAKRGSSTVYITKIWDDIPYYQRLPVRSKLEQLGYKFNNYSDSRDSWATISWN